MTSTPDSIRVFDPPQASEAEWIALNQFFNTLEAESFPDDDPDPVSRTKKWLLHMPEFAHTKIWLAYGPDGRQIVGAGRLEWWDAEDNQHLAEFYLQVLPEYRRQGIARRLLEPIVADARALNRRLLTTWTLDTVPAADAFMRRLGAEVGLETHLNQLVLADLDRPMLREWQDRVAEQATEFTIGLWEGRYPDERLAEIVELHKATNLAPRGTLDFEDDIPTVEQFRQRQDSMEERGDVRWTYYAYEKATGALAGFTEVWTHPDQPKLVWQGWTAVWPKYRNVGLGRWIKAAMLEKVLRELPQARFVRTGNADSNGPMLKINYDLGFKPFHAEQVWQVAVDVVDQYLATSREAVGSK